MTAGQALQHPNWVMGPKVTIDSATLMNKGLEVIEAHYLFGVPYEQIRVVVHPQSIVHSLVRFADGAVLAHLGVPDMRTPIGYALSYPGARRCRWCRRSTWRARELSFAEPDTATFRCLALARAAGEAAARAWEGRDAGDGGGAGAAAPIVLNAANEVAVAGVPRLGGSAFSTSPRWSSARSSVSAMAPVASIDDVFAVDAAARQLSARLLDTSS